MATAVIMPKAGITVETCMIGQWKVKVGDRVNVGDVLFTYETDKTAFECESTAAGELLDIFFGEGDEVPCLVNVCAIGEPGEDVSGLRPVIEEAQEQKKTVSTAAAVSGAIASTGTGAGDKISPRAKALAEKAGVDPMLATPTGPDGRIIERDIRRLMREGAPETVPEHWGEYEDVKFNSIRKTIAKTMYESIGDMAQLTHHFSFDATALMAARKRCKSLGGQYAGITVGDLINFAVARTLLTEPQLNANMYDETSIRHFKQVNLGVAVDTPRGLMVPTIFGADKLSLLDLSAQLKELAAGCREGNISPDKLKGGTFTVSNLGSFGVEVFTPVINPPQTGILGICTTIQRPRMGENGLELYPAMGLSLTYDHRALDGAPASRYMMELCKTLENIDDLIKTELPE